MSRRVERDGFGEFNSLNITRTSYCLNTSSILTRLNLTAGDEGASATARVYLSKASRKRPRRSKTNPMQHNSVAFVGLISLAFRK